jgi:hypothetical protein
MKKILFFAFCISIMNVRLSYGQAGVIPKIDESAIKQTLYVNNQLAGASNTNNGKSIDKPLLTIQKAVDLSKNIATKIVVYPGTYRESFNSSNNTALMIVEAQTEGTVIISGSQVYTNWTPDVSGKIYNHEWKFKWGEIKPDCGGDCGLTPLQKRKEMLFVNDLFYKQVLTKDKLTEGTFCVSETEGLIYVYPPETIDLNKAKVEVGVLGNNGSALASISDNKVGVVLRGLIFQHSVTYYRSEAVRLHRNAASLVEKCQFIWNGCIGCDGSGNNHIYRNCVFSNNGERGFGWGCLEYNGEYGVGSSNFLIDSCLAENNNWRLVGTKVAGWDAAACKIFGWNKNFTIQNCTFRGNQSKGQWIDWGNRDYVIKNCTFEKNLLEGLMLEGSPYKGTVKNSVIRYNGNGLEIYGHSNITVDSCSIYGNTGSQLHLGTDSRTYMMDDNHANTPLTNIKNLTLRNSQIYCLLPSQKLIETFTWGVAEIAGANLFETMKSDSNTWYHPNAAIKNFPTLLKDQYISYADWKTRTGNDKNSKWVNDLVVTDNQKPTAKFTFQKVGAGYRFDAKSSIDPENNISNFVWDFGDGTFDKTNKISISHTFSNQKSIKVKLKITDCFGLSDSITQDILATNVLKIDNEDIKFDIYPNPAHDQTHFHYSLRTTSLVKLQIYDLSGREVAFLINQIQASGEHDLNFSTTNLPSGIYSCQFTVGNNKIFRKLIVTKHL